jgi:hypothetical protein
MLTKSQKNNIIERIQNQVKKFNTDTFWANDFYESVYYSAYNEPIQWQGAQWTTLTKEREKDIDEACENMVKNELVKINKFVSKKGNICTQAIVTEKFMNLIIKN